METFRFSTTNCLYLSAEDGQLDVECLTGWLPKPGSHDAANFENSLLMTPQLGLPQDSQEVHRDASRLPVTRRNERERRRVSEVNSAFTRLRAHLPRQFLQPGSQRRRETRLHVVKRVSKVKTLRTAIAYIKWLENLLKDPSIPHQ